MYQMNLLTAGDYVQRTKAGILPVVIDSDGQVTMDLQLPETLGGFSYQEIAPVLGIDSAILASTNLPIEVVSTGLADLIIPVPIGQLDLINPNDLAITDFCKKHDIVGFHVFELCSSESSFTASCRNFAPLFGIPEESATGSASGALACYLAEHLPLDNKYIFEQGRAMNYASVITVSVGFQDAKIASVKVGGVANQIGSMFVPI